MAPHAFNNWVSSKNICKLANGAACDPLDVLQCAEKGGPAYITAELKEYGRHTGPTHHPPAGQHLMRGEILAYNYAHILLDAIYMIQADLKAGEEWETQAPGLYESA